MALVDQIIGVESGGNPNARNPRSSAGGAGQFIDATWLAMLAKHRPDIKGSREELLALKFDPALSKAMTEAYAAENSGILSRSGLPVTPGTQYLAHFAGPQGAVGVLSADPSVPVGSILGDAAVKANPFLRGMTAGDLAAWAERKMGGTAAAASPAQAPAQAPAASAPVAAATPAASPAPFSLGAGPMPAPAMPDISVPEMMAPPPMLMPKRLTQTRPGGGFSFGRYA